MRRPLTVWLSDDHFCAEGQQESTGEHLHCDDAGADAEPPRASGWYPWHGRAKAAGRTTVHFMFSAEEIKNE